ncbi:hypothetical protein LTR92_011321 [Exophiala xenobiotica]|nr:hypothetical protein LTR92_011321 [Exophiala xenobiotica]KAK5431528.1 hypothetical protein LTR18_011272 [Exophiala xenobiotica]KAK5461881.1 hypothetical protein LTR55_011872 [Exophiala xenobiotica]
MRRFALHDADDLFSPVLKGAAKRAGVDEIGLAEVVIWDGKEVLEELRLGDDGRWIDPTAMEGVAPAPTDVHRAIWAGPSSAMTGLIQNTEDVDAACSLEQANKTIRAENKAQGFPEDLIDGAYVIDIVTFKKFFQEAAPILQRLRKSHAHTEVQKTFEELNNRLKNFNSLHGYPEDWVMNLPAEDAASPTPPVGPGAATPAPDGSAPSTATAGPGTPRRRRIVRRQGLVMDGGVEKKIEEYRHVGRGHQLLISHAGKDGYIDFELVAASTFGKGFGQSYAESPQAVNLTLGPRGALKDRAFADMNIAGVASVRRDPSKGYSNYPMTIVLVTFKNEPAVVWLARSVLGAVGGGLQTRCRARGPDATYKKDAFLSKLSKLPKADPEYPWVKVKEANMAEDDQLEKYEEMQQANDVKLEIRLKYYQQEAPTLARQLAANRGNNSVVALMCLTHPAAGRSGSGMEFCWRLAN